MKDSTWAPAVESFIGYAVLATFCVDNSNDAKNLNNIIKEIYHNEKPPQIICGKFHNMVSITFDATEIFIHYGTREFPFLRFMMYVNIVQEQIFLVYRVCWMR